MPIVPVRGVGDIGLITDIPAHDLPFKAYTDARNMRFSNGNISRYSAFKYFDETYSYAKQPVGCLEGGGNEGTGYLVTVFNDGTMDQRFNGASIDVTPAGTLGSNTDQITTCGLGGVTYVNRSSDVPIYRVGPSSGAFTAIPGWDVNDRAFSMRAYKDFLIAINVTKPAGQYTTMVKWSDAAQAGVPPANWDVANPASLAGENVLNDCENQLIDGMSLADSFIIYGETQTFRMDYIGEPFVFAFRRLFDDQGMMTRNCVVDVDGKHYVFGNDDIFVHDGFSKMSIADNKVKETVFGEIDFEYRERCFVYHDQSKTEIAFCYPSVADDAAWPLAQVNGCNRAAVFNYSDNTWTIVDLPSAVAWTVTSEAKSVSWEDMDNWDQTAAAWRTFDGVRPPNLCLVGDGNATLAKAGTAYFVDSIEAGRLANPVDFSVCWDAYVLMEYMDLDETGIELHGRKMVRTIFPQFKTQESTAQVTIQFGQSNTPTTPISWQSPYTMTVWEDDKYDTRINGRYLAMRLDYPAGTDVTFSGFDVDLLQLSRR